MAVSMYPHAATVWHKIGEQGRTALWARAAVEPCRIDETTGSRRRPGGDSSARSALVIIPEPTRYGDGWIAEHDRICAGISDDPEPPKGAWGVARVKPVSIGRSVHHLEVTAE